MSHSKKTNSVQSHITLVDIYGTQHAFSAPDIIRFGSFGNKEGLLNVYTRQGILELPLPSDRNTFLSDLNKKGCFLSSFTRMYGCGKISETTINLISVENYEKDFHEGTTKLSFGAGMKDIYVMRGIAAVGKAITRAKNHRACTFG